jgi:hypothetical protein
MKKNVVPLFVEATKRIRRMETNSTHSAPLAKMAESG